MSDIRLKLGLPGPQELVVVNEFVDAKDPRNQGGPAGAAGEYRAVFVLSRPGIPLHPEYELKPAEHLRGDSHLAIAAPALERSDGGRHIRLRISDDKGQMIVFDGEANDVGFLGKLEARIQAENFNGAHRIAFGPLSAHLSGISLQLDIPLNIHQVDLYEIRTGNWRTMFSSPPFEAPIALAGEGTLSPEFRGYASLYREAQNSNSERYRYLCFFKILEALIGRRKRLAREALKIGKPAPNPPRETVPSDAKDRLSWLNALFRLRPDWSELDFSGVFLAEAVGREFSDIIETDLRPLRVKVAHALFEGQELALSGDDSVNLIAVTRWLPLVKCLVRRMLKNEFSGEFVVGLPD